VINQDEERERDQHGQYAVIEAPSVLGFVPGGVERLPAALLNLERSAFRVPLWNV
jgi:hypothetical protein